MSDDFVSYRGLEFDLGGGTPEHNTGQAGGQAGDRAHRHGAPADPAPPAARFFVRPGATPPPANDGAGLSARPIQPPRRPSANDRPDVSAPKRATQAPALRNLRLLAFNAELRPPVALAEGLVNGSTYADDRFDGLIAGLKARATGGVAR